MYRPLFTLAAGTPATPTPYILLSLLPAIIAAELALYGWHRRQTAAAMPFILLMTAVCFWSACHALSVASTTFATTLFWSQLQYGGIVLVAPLWLLFARTYHRSDRLMTPVQCSMLFLPALVIYSAVLTNGAHHLWWPTVALDRSRPFGSLQITHGFLFWLHLAYSYSCIALGFVLIMRRMRTTAPFQRRQARLVALGALFPIVGNLAHVFGIRTTVIDDPTPFFFVATGLITFYAALHYQFPDSTPVASETLFAQFPDGVVVLDHGGVVTALTAPVCRLLNLVQERTTWIGRPFQDSIVGSPFEHDVCSLLTSPDRTGVHPTAVYHMEGTHTIEVRLWPLYAEATRAGALLLVRDWNNHSPQHTLNQHERALAAISRLSHAANTTPGIDALMHASIRELGPLLPQDRIVIALIDLTHATVHLAGEQVPALPSPLLESILQAKQPHVSQLSDAWLTGTPLHTILTQQDVQALLVIPLVYDTAPLGGLVVGFIDARRVAPDVVQLCATIGAVMTTAIGQQQRSEQDQKMYRDMLRFFAATTHEMRTPLTALLGFTDLLARGIYGDLPKRVHEPLEAMRRNGQILLALINDILDMAKLQAGQFTIECAPVDITAVIRDVVRAMEPLIHERGLSVQLDFAPEIPLVYGQRERLAQVLTNLLANALKFTGQGVITVRTLLVGQRVRFSVSDTGMGIAPEQQEAIFEEFHQVVSPHQDRTPGTGLGLPISRRLMELMSGTLTVESTPGLGSTFSGEVPIAQEQLQTKAYGTSL